MNGKQIPNRYKLTPQIDKAMKILAQSLGNFQRKDNQGNLMYQRRQKFLGIFDLPNGKKEKRWENSLVPVFVNHYIDLVTIYQKEGDEGVRTYMKFFTELREKHQAEEKLKSESKLSIVKDGNEKESVSADSVS